MYNKILVALGLDGDSSDIGVYDGYWKKNKSNTG